MVCQPSNFTCDACPATYATARNLDLHQKTRCSPSKRNLEQLLGQANALWEARKRRRMDRGEPLVPTNRQAPTVLPESQNEILTPPANLASETVPPDHDLPIAQRRPKRTSRTAPHPPLVDFEEDSLPEPLALLDVAESPTTDHRSIMPNNRVHSSGQPLQVSQWWQSKSNKFSLWRRHYGRSPPTRDPEQELTVEDYDDSQERTEQESPVDSSLQAPFGPFPNRSSFLFADWWWNGENDKSGKELARFLAMGRDESFCFQDVLSTNWKAALDALDSDDGSNSGDDWFDDANWISMSITIPVPFHRLMKNSGIENVTVGTLHHRRLVSVIEEKIRNSQTTAFHYQPSEVFWSPPSNEDDQHIRVHGELYNSKAFVEAHQALQDSPPISGCELERVIMALMFWSDETHLSAFGSAKIWPCYLFFGNESKYRRSKTSLKLCEHIAYFDSLPDSFKDHLRHRNGGKLPPKDLISHCARQMFHTQWDILLGDKELLDAMKSGMVIMCSDGLKRRFFPAVFTYSADYPEKVRVASVKQNGRFPCPTCLVAKQDVHNMGTSDDIQFRMEHPRLHDDENREMIAKALQAVKDGYAVTGTVVEGHLQSRSLLPIENAFQTHLSHFGFNVYQSLVVDLMHEFEIGVWKGLYMHLLRLLEACGKQADLTAELDERYRQIPSFGRDTIRKFAKNASVCKRRAARDYEDLLQCSISAFEGLLPSPHNEIVMELLFDMCNWHALAKLRLHHELTLDLLDSATTKVASQFRKFVAETCQRVPTLELQREAKARAKRAANKADTSLEVPSAVEGPQGATTTAPSSAVPATTPPSAAPAPATTLPTAAPAPAKGSARKPKRFSLSTPKYHALGHYAEAIRRYGTTDSFTSEIGETNHPAIKTWYKRTDPRNYPVQIAKIFRRRARFRRLKSKLVLGASSTSCDRDGPVDEYIPGLAAPTRAQYYIGESKVYQDLNTTFTNPPNMYDPIIASFVPKLKRHLLPRILYQLAPHLYPRPSTMNCSSKGSHPLQEEWAGVTLRNNRVYTHKILHVKYTTYDVRREEDIVSLKSESNIMVLDEDYEHNSAVDAPPYRYARVMGIYHADVILVGKLLDGTTDYTPHRIDFLWVRWYVSCGYPTGHSLERLHLEPLVNPLSFGFLDPRRVLRAAHLTPQFSRGKHQEPRIGPWVSSTQQWKFYFVNRFVDRDMFMRYHWKLAIGHVAVQRRYQTSSNTSLLAHEDPQVGFFPPLDISAVIDTNSDYESSVSSGSDDDADS